MQRTKEGAEYRGAEATREEKGGKAEKGGKGRKSGKGDNAQFRPVSTGFGGSSTL